MQRAIRVQPSNSMSRRNPPPSFVRRLLRDAGYYAWAERRSEREISADPARFDPMDDGRPMPPPYFLTLVAGTPSQRWFSEHGRRHAEAIKAFAAEAGLGLDGGLRVLDVGCGCGRIARWLAPDVERGGGAFRGVDIQRPLAAWCAAHLPGTYRVNRTNRPLPVESGEVDLLYAFSVATHLTRRSLRTLLADLARVLRPGGMALVTFHDEDFASEPYREALARDGYALSSPRAEGLNHMSAWATRDTFAALCAERFEVTRIVPSDRANGEQAIAVLRKPPR